MDRGRLHIVMFPWLAFGHMIPYLELSKALAKTGHLVSFLSTPTNIQRLPKLPPNLSPLINLVHLPFPHIDGLPDNNAESTTDLPSHQVQYLKKALDCLQEPLANFLKEASPRPDWILFDFAQYWVPSLASRFGVKSVFFSVFSVWCHGFLGPPSKFIGTQDPWTSSEQFTVPPHWIPHESKVAFRLYEAQGLESGLIHSNATGVSDMYRSGTSVQDCDIFALRGCRELEPEWLSLIQELYNKPVMPVGLLPPLLQERADEDEISSSVKLFEWLDKQKLGSVVYIAFGSEAVLSSELLHELAFGLEQSNMSFLWALRKPPGSPEEILPEGFEDRTEDRGLVATGWVPQVRVLAHPSIGVFLTHSGLSSVVEGLQFGLPFVMLPMIADQSLITQVLEERKVGVEIPRDEKDGSFTRDGVVKCLKSVMEEEEGEIFRAEARKAREIFGDRVLQYQYVETFAQYLTEH